MVERLLSMREVPGSIPGSSKTFPHFFSHSISSFGDQRSVKTMWLLIILCSARTKTGTLPSPYVRLFFDSLPVVCGIQYLLSPQAPPNPLHCWRTSQDQYWQYSHREARRPHAVPPSSGHRTPSTPLLSSTSGDSNLSLSVSYLTGIRTWHTHVP